eukprot:GILK01008833.1.p1 GENE.GILK01008833.1~~GILK01008833.1.p1  ORF type:complete len:294 (-),score=37.65 GILK01008833.1:68-949(-)
MVVSMQSRVQSMLEYREEYEEEYGRNEGVIGYFAHLLRLWAAADPGFSTENEYLSIYNIIMQDLPPDYETTLTPSSIDPEKREDYATLFEQDDVLIDKTLSLWLTLVAAPLCHTFSFGVPNGDAIAALKQFSPLVEIGAGTGYWSSMLQAAGAEVVAFDIHPPETKQNAFHAHSFAQVQQGNAESLRHYSTSTLFLCWPPLDDSMAEDCLAHFTGTHVAFVGELKGDSISPYPSGLTATKEFLDTLVKDFEMILKIDLPHWPFVRDSLSIWRRYTTVSEETGTVVTSDTERTG